MARVLVLDVKEDEFRVADCNELDDFYRELDASPLDVAVRKVGYKAYDIYVDDEGLFRENPVLSAVSCSGEPMFVGNLIFANNDKHGNTVSLTDADIANIMSNVAKIYTKEKPAGYRAVVCEY